MGPDPASSLPMTLTTPGLGSKRSTVRPIPLRCSWMKAAMARISPGGFTLGIRMSSAASSVTDSSQSQYLICSLASIATL